MARFRGGVQGNRQKATRQGHRLSGLETFANGWNAGVEVDAFADDTKENENDLFRVMVTGGSHRRNNSMAIGTAYKHKGRLVFELADNQGFLVQQGYKTVLVASLEGPDCYRDDAGHIWGDSWDSESYDGFEVTKHCHLGCGASYHQTVDYNSGHDGPETCTQEEAHLFDWSRVYVD